MSGLPAGWSQGPLKGLVDVLDSVRVPLNATERERRIAGKSEKDLFPYYGATGRVGSVDDFLFDEPLILLGEDGVPFLDPMRPKAYRVVGKCWVNNHAHVLRVRAGVADERYVAAFLNSFDYTGFVTGSTRLKLTQAAMNSIPVRIAPLNEQKRIADKLDAVLARVDACRERLDRVPAILKRFRQSVLAAATSGKLTEDWREERSRRKQEWPTVRVDQIVTIRNGRAFPSPDYSEEGVRLLRPGNLHISGRVVWEANNTKCLPRHYATEYPTYLLGEGELVMNLTAQSLRDEFLGRVCMKHEAEPALLNQRICAFYTITDWDVRPFLFVYFRSPAFRSYVDTLDSGTLIKHMHSKQVLKHEIRLPPRDEADEICRRTNKLLAAAEHVELAHNRIQTLAGRLPSGLLGKAFRGTLVPQDPDDEPGSVMLERIRAARQTAPTQSSHRKGGSRPSRTRNTDVTMPNRSLHTAR